MYIFSVYTGLFEQEICQTYIDLNYVINFAKYKLVLPIHYAYLFSRLSALCSKIK